MKPTVDADRFECYSFNQIAVFGDQQSTLLAKFVFRISAFCFNPHVDWLCDYLIVASVMR